MAIAICFELMVNFGTNIEAAQQAALTNPQPMADQRARPLQRHSR
jgi:hypothetical protein